MAEVFLATAFGASGFERQVVVKVLRSELQGDATYERMFLEEARVGARLSHQNLVSVHELGIADGRYWARMDWVDGLTLGALLERGPLPVAQALTVASEVALGLGHLHGARDEAGRPLGLVHRDVSPNNVLISFAGEVRLSDFGVAKATLLKEVTRSGVTKGTYAYMSPEQVSGRRLSPASDVFSLGILLAELLTGERPFDAATPLETMDRIRAAKPPVLERVPSELRGLLMTALRATPEERFQSARDFFDALWTGPVAPGSRPELADYMRGTRAP